MADLSQSRRGFTDHEHLDELALIHMNGRVYDYNLGRFMSVDPVIQSPGNSQSINPYSYIMNNPLAGTDPTGYVSECAEGEVCEQPTRRRSGVKGIVAETIEFHSSLSDTINNGSTTVQQNNTSDIKKAEIGSVGDTAKNGTNENQINPEEHVGGRGIPKNKFKLDANGDIEYSTEITGPFVESKNQVVTDDIAKIRFQKAGVNYYHSGKDIVPLNPNGTVKTDDYAISGTEGKILAIRPARGFGKNVVIVETPKGNHVIYGHLESVAKGLKVGQTIKTGTRLGIIGNEGLKTSAHPTKGLHLHVEIREGNIPFTGLRFGIK